MREGRGGQLAVGFVLLHVLCCGLPLLLAAGAFGGVGALLGSPLLLAVGAVAVLAAVVPAVVRMRTRRAACCPTSTLVHQPGQQPRLSEQPAEVPAARATVGKR